MITATLVLLELSERVKSRSGKPSASMSPILILPGRPSPEKTRDFSYLESSFWTSKSYPVAVKDKGAKNLFASPIYLLTEETADLQRLVSVCAFAFKRL